VSGALFALYGASVVQTDVPDVMPHLDANVDLNFPRNATGKRSASIVTAPLSWASPPQSTLCTCACHYDLIIATDCVYWEELFDPLLSTLTTLTQNGHDVATAGGGEAASPSSPLVLLAQTDRRPRVERRFFKALARTFACACIFDDLQDGRRADSRNSVRALNDEGRVRVLLCQRRTAAAASKKKRHDTITSAVTSSAGAAATTGVANGHNDVPCK
jgi:predicted nicotinamide N-methyase